MPMLRRLAKTCAYSPVIQNIIPDLIQVGALAIVNVVHRFDPNEGKSLPSWLRLKAEYAMRDEIRNERQHSESRVADSVDLIEMCGNEPPTQAFIALEKSLSVLTDQQRKAIHLHFVEGWSKADIGAEFGVSRERGRQIIEQALATLRKEMKAGEAGG